MDYLGTIRDLADKLKVGQFFDLAVIKELIAKKDSRELCILFSCKKDGFSLTSSF